MALITYPNPECRRANISDAGKCPGCGYFPKTYAEAKLKEQEEILTERKKQGICPECNGRITVEKSLGTASSEVYNHSTDYNGGDYIHRFYDFWSFECPNCGWREHKQENGRRLASSEANRLRKQPKNGYTD